jgi:2-dehydropantoate 2-reductase
MSGQSAQDGAHMQVTVVGLGAIGGFLAARLGAAGHRVQALARGPTLAAVHADGLRLTTRDGRTWRQPIVASDRAADLAPTDLLVIALKGPALVPALPSLQPLLASRPTVLPAMNGVPWWFLRPAPEPDARPLQSVDPQGVVSAAMAAGDVLGCVVHVSCSSPAPGHVVHHAGERLIVGEIAGGPSERVDRVASLLRGAGLDVEASADVRSDVWYKLWGNMTMNPVSALTGATSDRILDDELVRAFMARAMDEAAAIGARIGCPIAQGADERMALTRQLGGFKTSMLQDAEAGRPLEVDALLSAVREIGQRVGVPTPNVDALLGLTRLMARTRGLLPH